MKKLRNLVGHKPKKGELQGHNLKLTLDILELMMKSKKKILGDIYGSF